MQNSAAAMDKMQDLQKIKDKTLIWSSNPTFGSLLKTLKSGSQRDNCSPIFPATLLTIAKLQKQPELMGEKENLLYTYSGILFSL